MEVNVASRKDLADAIQSYNDNDNITFISGAKIQNKFESSKDLAKKINFFKNNLEKTYKYTTFASYFMHQ